MDIKTFTDKLTELNWPKKVTLSPPVFWEVKELAKAPLASIAVPFKGTSELSFMFEVTKVCLAEDVTRPDTADLTEFGVAPPVVLQPVEEPAKTATVNTGEKPFVPPVTPLKPTVQ